MYHGITSDIIVIIILVQTIEQKVISVLSFIQTYNRKPNAPAQPQIF